MSTANTSTRPSIGPTSTGPNPGRTRPKVMTITPAAAARVKAIMATKGANVTALKIGIKKGGCAGMEYTMDWAESAGKFDEIVEQDGARVIIDPKAVMYLLGTEMDYKADKLSAQFVFNNPNQQGSCGCGESVNLVPISKDQAASLASS
jgi:iron-sulfur cluster assembly protein